jgi:hypothetical protein
MKILAIATQFNAEGKRDADEFRREAAAFVAFHDPSGANSRVALIDNTMPMPMRKAAVVAEIKASSGLDCVAFFCHGWSSGIQLGFVNSSARDLSSTIADSCADVVTVPLFCCSTGYGGSGGNGGFADRLRDDLSKRVKRATVDAHVTKGHCTRNPHVRRFESPEGVGGQYIVAQMSPKWKEWKRALQTTDLRMAFPFLTRQQILEAL